MNTEVAVVIPAHNAAPHLGVALRSLREQTLRPTEVVVVDDGSTDDTAAVAEAGGARVIRQDQRGPAAARNRGVAATRASQIAFLDADDWFAPHKLEHQVAHLDDLGAAAVCSDAWVVIGDEIRQCKNIDRRVAPAITAEALLGGNPVICSTVMMRREAFAAVGGFDEQPDLIATEDYDLWLRLAQREPIAYTAEPTAFYRVHPGSLSNNPRFLRGVEVIMRKAAETYGPEPHYSRLIKRRLASLRVDLAWDRLRAGDRPGCRALLREAGTIHGIGARGCRLWLRSLLPI